MRAQLMEFTATNWRPSGKKVWSPKLALTMFWQSSKLPSSAILNTFGASTVVIWRRWTLDTRLCGCMIKISMLSQRRQPSIAAEPVSPDVAPITTTFWLRFFNKWSSKWPKNCNAKSLNARVGPWNNSKIHSLWPVWTKGAMASWRKVA